MLLVRKEFQIKYGKIKEAVEIWKELISFMEQKENWQKVKLLTDITGSAYYLVVEYEIRDMQDYTFMIFQRANNEDAADLYKKFSPLCNSAKRILYNIEA